MTKLKDKVTEHPPSRRPSIIRESPVTLHNRPVVIELYERYLVIRLKGTQRTVVHDYLTLGEWA